ncbi:MAG: cyclic nucleotide-binding domain-containing protein [Actinobacteria bacterium]|nr:cyclic nucleotide-binding domain-containing protein [Actinomycetota bacterium]
MGRGRSGAFVALRARTGLRRVLLAYACYSFVEFSTWLVVVLWAYAEGGAELAALAAVVQLIPAALLAPGIAAIGDRLPRGRALVIVHSLVLATLLLTTAALLLDLAVPVVLTAGTLLTTALAAVRPVHFSALPALAPGPEALVSANSLSSMIDGSMQFIGPVVGGFVVATWGTGAGMLLASAAMLLAPLLCLGLRLGRAADADREEHIIVAALGGLRALSGDVASLTLLLVMALDFVLAGALDVLGISYADSVLGSGEAGAGLLIGALGLGSLIGAFAASFLARRAHLAPLIAIAGVLQGAAFASVALTSSTAGGFALLVVTGACSGVVLVAGRTLLQRSTDDVVLARVFAVQESTSLIGLSIGAGIVPFLLTELGAAGAWVPLGLGAVLIAGAGFLLVRKLDVRAVLRPFEIALLRRVPFLAAMPPYQLERMAAGSSWRDVGAGEAVVSVGAAGDEFYVVEAGDLVVDVPGVATRPTIGAGGFFGEVALLRSVPRTATVTTVTPSRLLVVARDEFLEAVTGGTDGDRIAAELSDRYRDLDPA